MSMHVQLLKGLRTELFAYPFFLNMLAQPRKYEPPPPRPLRGSSRAIVFFLNLKSNFSS